jgi:hypothetical protein
MSPLEKPEIQHGEDEMEAGSNRAEPKIDTIDGDHVSPDAIGQSNLIK